MFAQRQSAFGKKLEMALLRFPQIFRRCEQKSVVLIKLLIFSARYQFSYRMEKNRDVSIYRFIVPPLLYSGLPHAGPSVLHAIVCRAEAASPQAL